MTPSFEEKFSQTQAYGAFKTAITSRVELGRHLVQSAHPMHKKTAHPGGING